MSIIRYHGFGFCDRCVETQKRIWTMGGKHLCKDCWAKAGVHVPRPWTDAEKEKAK